jgi:hypothetical protein
MVIAGTQSRNCTGVKLCCCAISYVAGLGKTGKRGAPLVGLQYLTWPHELRAGYGQLKLAGWYVLYFVGFQFPGARKTIPLTNIGFEYVGENLWEEVLSGVVP